MQLEIQVGEIQLETKDLLGEILQPIPEVMQIKETSGVAKRAVGIVGQLIQASLKLLAGAAQTVLVPPKHLAQTKAVDGTTKSVAGKAGQLTQKERNHLAGAMEVIGVLQRIILMQG